MKLEDLLRPTQKQLFDALKKSYQGVIYCKGYYLMVKGDAPVMLVAHLDTVHQEPVKQICQSEDGNILMSPQGIGGDDRCGVYALIKAYDLSPKKPWLLFTCDEETGGKGAKVFCKHHTQNEALLKGLDCIKFLVEIDRKGKKDAVYYDCDNPDFEKYISSKGFKTAYGLFSDISLLAPELKVAAVNLSSGYYNAHTQHEYINRKHLEKTVQKVVGIIAEADTLPKYEYIKRKFSWNYGNWGFGKGKTFEGDIPDDVPDDILSEYIALLDIYPEKELHGYLKEYGKWAIIHLYESEILGEDYEYYKEGAM